jgi:hypothetical protein
MRVDDQQKDAVLLNNRKACAKRGIMMKSGDSDKKSNGDV